MSINFKAGVFPIIFVVLDWTGLSDWCRVVAEEIIS